MLDTALHFLRWACSFMLGFLCGINFLLFLALFTKVPPTFFFYLHSLKPISSKKKITDLIPNTSLLKVIFHSHECYNHLALSHFYFLHFIYILNLCPLLECKFLKVRLYVLFNSVFCLLLTLLPKVSSRGLTHRWCLINVCWKNQWNTVLSLLWKE